MSSQAPPAPIVVFAYRRPAHLRRALASLARNPLARESPLVIFCDGARDPAAAAEVADVRRIARSARGFRSVSVVERERNLGLMASIVDGVGSMTREFGRVIVVEDDLVVAPQFLEFMNLALAKYAGSSSVMQVSGFQFDLRTTPMDEGVFLPMISCWGWATWSRAWEAFASAAEAYERLKADPLRRKRFDLDGAYDYFDLLEKQVRGEVDSWGIWWYLSVFDRDGLVLYPPRSLVTNTGFDGSGTHGVGNDGGLASSDAGGFALAKLRLPSEERLTPQALNEVKRILITSRKGPFARMLGRFEW